MKKAKMLYQFLVSFGNLSFTKKGFDVVLSGNVYFLVFRPMMDDIVLTDVCVHGRLLASRPLLGVRAVETRFHDFPLWTFLPLNLVSRPWHSEEMCLSRGQI